LHPRFRVKIQAQLFAGLFRRHRFQITDAAVSESANSKLAADTGAFTAERSKSES
jgi:hypothetical protein